MLRPPLPCAQNWQLHGQTLLASAGPNKISLWDVGKGCRVRRLEVAKDPPIRLTWEITPLGQVCKLVLTHDEFDGETATYRAVTSGVPAIMAGIKTLLETGAPLTIPQ